MLESTHSAQFGPKLLKELVQKFRNFALKFENRLLGPTNYFGDLEKFREGEQEVLRHQVDGMTKREITHLLEITEAPVKWHVNTILMGLNVSDRTHAVVTALQRGLAHL